MARFSINQSDDWHVVYGNQDVRGWPVQDAAGETVGHVSDLIADTDSKLVETVELDNGTEYPARDVELGDGVVFLEGVPEEAAGSEPVVKIYDEAAVRRREEGGATGFAKYEPGFREHYSTTYGETEKEYGHFHPAYRLGYDYGMLDGYRDREWNAVESEIQSDYEDRYGKGTWGDVSEAARHAFRRARTVGR